IRVETALTNADFSCLVLHTELRRLRWSAPLLAGLLVLLLAVISLGHRDDFAGALTTFWTDYWLFLVLVLVVLFLGPALRYFRARLSSPLAKELREPHTYLF